MNQKYITSLLRAACVITRSDAGLAAQSNGFDKATIHASAVALILAFVVATLAWSAFFASFLSLPAAITLGTLSGILVFVFDQALGASDWELAGVLATAKASSAYWLKVGLRIGVALLLAQATAVGATLALFRDAIDNRLQSNRLESNAPVQEEYARAKADLASRLIEPATTRLKQVDEDRARAIRAEEEARAVRLRARQQAASARVEAGREITGGLDGYIRGDGPRHKEALRQEQEADHAEADAAAEFAAAGSTLSRIEHERVEVLKEMAAAEGRMREQSAALDRSLEADARYVPHRNDPLLRYMALHQIKSDPVTGPPARSFSLLMNLVLVTFELMFLLIKMVFAPASVYTVRLIARTRAEAATVAVEYGRTLDGLRQNPHRPSLRVVGGTEAQPQMDGGMR